MTGTSSISTKPHLWLTNLAIQVQRFTHNLEPYARSRICSHPLSLSLLACEYAYTSDIRCHTKKRHPRCLSHFLLYKNVTPGQRPRRRQCLPCGPGGQGRCFGPRICCGEAMGCRLGGPDVAICRAERLMPSPCESRGEPCGHGGKCGAPGLCCSSGEVLQRPTASFVTELFFPCVCIYNFFRAVRSQLR